MYVPTDPPAKKGDLSQVRVKWLGTLLGAVMRNLAIALSRLFTAYLDGCPALPGSGQLGHAFVVLLNLLPRAKICTRYHIGFT